MNPQNLIVDLHCHPALKPYGRSFDSPATQGQNSPMAAEKNSIWNYDPPTWLDKFFNWVLGITEFRQADFTSSLYGQVKVMVVSMYPLEKGFVVNKLGTGELSDAGINIATGVGVGRINYLQAMPDYFKDLCGEYDFLCQLNGKTVMIDGKPARYVIARHYSDLADLIQSPSELSTIAIVLSIEGPHVFNAGIPGKIADETEVLANIAAVKKWEFPPFFITMAHHFWNEFCGHAPSLSGLLNKVLDQSPHMNEGYQPLGEKVVRALLSKTNGPRILIDLKHMSAASRRRYYEILDQEYVGDPIPLVVSHGACNGLWADNNNYIVNHITGPLLNPSSINFFDEELIRIAKSGGVIGLQMDERRLVNEHLLPSLHRIDRKQILTVRSKLIWNQIQHIAETLSTAGLYPWSIQSMGTDYDGIIDPLNGFWTHEDLQTLDDYLLIHARAYMADRGRGLKVGSAVTPEEIVSRVMQSNALEFLKKNF